MSFLDRNIPYILDILSNDNVSDFTNFIIWMNVFAATFAMSWNIAAARNALTLGRKIMFTRIASIAGIFVVAYSVLLFDVDYRRWSEIMQGVSLIAWIFVWAGPARESQKQDKLIADEVRKEITARMKYNLEKNLNGGD